MNPRAILEALNLGKVPVISSVAPDAAGQLLNVVKKNKIINKIAIVMGSKSDWQQ